MALTMDMLSVIKQTTPPGPVPDGLKVTALASPTTLNNVKECPVLAIGSFVYWPFSYIDNRVSFCITSYEKKGAPVNQVEIKGARYVYKITLEGSGSSGSVTFWGQADQKVTMNLDQVYSLLMKK